MERKKGNLDFFYKYILRSTNTLIYILYKKYIYLFLFWFVFTLSSAKAKSLLMTKSVSHHHPCHVEARSNGLEQQRTLL